MREARNRQGSTPLFRSALVVRFETCTHGARIRQPTNLTSRYRQPTGALSFFLCRPFRAWCFF